MIRFKRHFGILAACLLMSINSVAGDFFFGLAARSGNLWISPLGAFALSKDLSYDWMSVKDADGKIDVKDGNPFGFQARDLFRSFGLGVTVGFQPKFSPLGIYATGGYDFRQFRMQPDRSLTDYEKYKPSSFNVGIGIRIAPALLFTDEEPERTPFVEIGTKYNQVFSCKAPFDNAKDQFNSGFTTRFSIGLRNVDSDDGTYSFFIYYEMPTYDYFNKDFTLSDGTKPYENIKSKMHRVGLGLTMEF